MICSLLRTFKAFFVGTAIFSSRAIVYLDRNLSTVAITYHLEHDALHIDHTVTLIQDDRYHMCFAKHPHTISHRYLILGPELQEKLRRVDHISAFVRGNSCPSCPSCPSPSFSACPVCPVCHTCPIVTPLTEVSYTKLFFKKDTSPSHPLPDLVPSMTSIQDSSPVSPSPVSPSPVSSSSPSSPLHVVMWNHSRRPNGTNGTNGTNGINETNKTNETIRYNSSFSANGYSASSTELIVAFRPTDGAYINASHHLIDGNASSSDSDSVLGIIRDVPSDSEDDSDDAF